MQMIMQKEQAYKLIDRMSQNATWDNLLCEIYACEVIEQGMVDSNEGWIKDVKEFRAKFGLPAF